MPRSAQILRQWRVWRLLARSASALSAQEIVERLQPDAASARTVRRDLELLRELGVPVTDLPQGRDVRYTILDDGPLLRIDPDTLLALHLALGLLQPLQGTAIEESLDQLTRTLESRVPNGARAHFGCLAEDLHVRLPGAPSYRSSAAVLTAVRVALAERRVLTIEYQALATGERTTRAVHPQALVHGPRGLYLFARDELRKMAARLFRIDRIQSAVAEDRRADPADLDPEDYLADSLGVFSAEHEVEVFRLRLHTAPLAQLLRENPWHPTQTIADEPDGTWLLTLTLSSSRELLPRILAAGPAAEVLEPAWFRREAHCATRDALARYERS